MEYQSQEFCEAVACPWLAGQKDCIAEKCTFSARHFHGWLKGNEFKIIKSKACKKIAADREQAILRDQIFSLVKDARSRQDDKWGEQNHDPFTWVAILGEEVGEVNKAALEARFSDESWLEEYGQELVQVAAVAISMIECLERRKWAWATPNHNVNEGDQP